MPAESAAAHRPLNCRDLRTLGLSALGGALEFYDFVIFVFFAALIGQLFFPPEMPAWLRQLQAFGLFAAGYLARPLGGIVMAHFGDRLGRKRMFSLGILLMALPTLCMGLLPTYAQIGLWAPLALLLLRVLQGAAIGGEVPGAWVFVAEHVSPRHTGLACSTLTAGLCAGILLGSLTAGLVNRVFAADVLADWGWRLPFLLGGVFGLVSVYLRRWLQETPVFAELQQRQQLAEELPVGPVLRQHRPAVWLSMLLTWVLAAGIVVVVLLTPSILQSQYGFTAAEALQANGWAIVGLTLGCVLAGLAIDRFGPGPTCVLGGLLLLGCSLLFYLGIRTHRDALVPLYALAGLSVGVIGAIPAMMVRVFPAEVRFSGLSFSYNLAYAICGGLTPVLVGLLLHWSPLGPAFYVVLLCLVLVATGGWLWRRGLPVPVA